MKEGYIDGKILILDDEREICILVKSILKRVINFEVKIADSVGAALDVIKKEPFDFYIFDYRLGDGTSIEVIHELKKTYSFERQIPVVVMSAYTSDEDIRKLEEVGIELFIPKPLKREDIVSCAENFFNTQSNP